MNLIARQQTHPMWQPQSEGGATFDDEMGHLVMGWPDVTDEHINKFQGPGKFGLMDFRSIIVISLQFDASLGFCLPYHAGLIEHTTPIEQLQGDERRLLSLALVEARTGEVMCLRASTIAPHVSQRMRRAIARQLRCPITCEEFIAQANDWNRMYPTRKSVLRTSTLCKLGG